MRARLRRLAALAAAAAAAASTAAIPAATGAERPVGAADLRREHAALASRSASALLELYALESRVATAREAAGAAAGRAAAVRAEHERVARQHALARRTAVLAERLLADRLRALYEAGDVHPLAILLGAASLDEALTGLDGLRFAAEQDGQIVARTRATRRALARAERLLAERQTTAEAAAQAAAAQARELERAQAERQADVRRLAARLRLGSAELAALERQAARARSKAQALSTPARAATPTAAPATAPAAPPVQEVQGGGESALVSSGRTLTVSSTGYALPGRTATGIPVAHGVVAVDPSVIPLGTRLAIPGYGEGVAADVGSAVKGYKIDLWFPTRAEALRWGRRTITITIR